MGKVVIMDHPLLQHKIGIMRMKETSTKDFRDLVNEVAMLIYYEASRDLPLADKEIETTICKTTVKEIAGKKKVAAEELEQMRRAREKDAEDQARKIVEDAKDEAKAMRQQIVDGARKEITEMVEEAAEKILLSEDVSMTYDAFLDAAERSVPDDES